MASPAKGSRKPDGVASGTAVSTPHPSRAELAHLAFLEQRWASFWRRYAASFIDCFILCCVILLEAAAFSWLTEAYDEDEEGWSSLILWSTWVLSVILFHTVLVGSKRVATPGRMAAGVAVVDAKTGGPIGFWRALLRAALSVAAVCFIVPNLLVLVTLRKRSIADLAARTVVVRYKLKGRAAIGIALIASVGPLVGVLALVSWNEYQSYTMSMRVEETRRNLTTCARLMERAWRATGEVPKSLDRLGFVPTEDYAEFSIRQDGVITARFLNSNSSIMLQPNYNRATDTLTWACFAYGLSPSRAIRDCKDIPR